MIALIVQVLVGLGLGVLQTTMALVLQEHYQLDTQVAPQLACMSGHGMHMLALHHVSELGCLPDLHPSVRAMWTMCGCTPG